HQTQSDTPKQVTRTNERSRGTYKDIEKLADVTRIEHYSSDNGDTQSVGQDNKPNRKGTKRNRKRERDFSREFKKQN
ncbi:hypothetical protein, partial [Staphylococcus aureus]|uniref:hypothetical protein n=1 Tax=Staphylococcus aureus TaxID=1280 RepID=UPI0028966BBD